MNQKENKWSKFFYSKWFIIFVLAAILFACFTYARSYFQDYQIRQQIEQLKSEAAALESKKIQTMEIMKYVKSPEFVEEKARMEFNMIKPGEQTAVILKSNTATSFGNGQREATVVESNRFSNLIKWWNLFTKN
jgi:cell division protein FtsB